MTSEPVLSLITARTAVRDAVLKAIMASGYDDTTAAWQVVDACAINLAKAREHYDVWAATEYIFHGKRPEVLVK
jgi:hypothetical protein